MVALMKMLRTNSSWIGILVSTVYLIAIFTLWGEGGIFVTHAAPTLSTNELVDRFASAIAHFTMAYRTIRFAKAL